jgi:hypothetical protein
MASFKKRWDTKQKNEAIKSMKSIIKLLESGKYVVLEHGIWPGLDGKQNFKIIVKDSES